MRLLKSFTIVFLSFCCLTLTAKENKPYGLLTDLLEHTDYTWHNGYASNVPVWQADKAIENLQYAEIMSAFPTFSWIVPGSEQGTYQVSYRFIIADNIGDALAGKGDVWDSGTVESKKSTSILFEGNALKPENNYFWRVKVVTNTGGESEWSDVKAFRTAGKMSDYSVSHYPQVKSLEHPVSINKIGASTTFIDFGKAAFGQVVLRLTSDNDKDSVVVHIGECVENGRVLRAPGWPKGPTVRYHRYSIGLMKGTHTYRIKIAQDERNTIDKAIKIPDYIGEVLPFRYCEIEGYDKQIATTDAVREFVHYPFDDLASYFESSNDILNQVWDLCKYSMKATSFLGVYVDGDRERIPYEADALINQLSHYGADREFTMARRTHEYLLEYPTWPTEWILQAIIIAWNDYIYTGDIRSLKANYDILKVRTLLQLREKNGLISTSTGLVTEDFYKAVRYEGAIFGGIIKDIVDWPQPGIFGWAPGEGGESDHFVFTDYNAVTNAYHYEALKLMNKIAIVLGHRGDSFFFNNESKQFLARYNKMFFNNKLGRYVDGDTTNHSSVHANMFPVAFGMTPPGKLNSVIDFIQSRGMACSVYASQFLMDALYEASDSEYALNLMTKTDDRSWYNMIRVGSTITLEAWDNKYKPNQDWNHAWGAAPGNIIPRKLMGVEPIEPGFNKVRIKPQTASLEWAKAVIPTIKGAISLNVENKKGEYRMELAIPANMESEVYLPLLSKKYEVSVNGIKQSTTLSKDAPFVCLGNIPSGKYTIVMSYSE